MANSKAIFISYAHEDVDAARRIADALRAFGVEVWFDSNELRGGDLWDAKIRSQIKACGLFIPIISQTTQTRREAYFRLEWKLADDRTHLLAPGTPFLVPVVIDDTPEYEAGIPESFAKAQSTRLPGGEPTPEFVAQVKKLATQSVAMPPPAHRAAPAEPRPAPVVTPPTTAKRGTPPWIWLAGLGVVAIAAIAITRNLGDGEKTVPAIPPPAKPAQAVPVSGHIAPPSSLPATSADKSIAVLPFANLSADADNAFFADGMHDDRITALAKVRDLKVISRTSVLAYRDTAARNLRKIAAELGVAAVMEGSVQRAGNRVRINFQLIDARTDAHLWAETYNRELNDIFAIQAELVQQVTGALKATLTAGEQDLLARRPTESQIAYDLYLRARLLGQGLGPNATKTNYEAVIALYEQAAVADPKFALPHVQASILHGRMFWFGNLDATPERRARVEASLAVAERLAPDAPETHLARGSFEYACRNDWARSLVEYRKAEAGLPNDAQLIYRIGIAHRRLGQFAEAQQLFERANGLNPSDLNVVISHFESLLETRRYRRILDEIDRFTVLFPKERRVMTVRLRAGYALDGDRPAFLRDMAARALAEDDPHGLAADFDAAMKAGDFVAADRILADPRMPASASEAGGALNYPMSLTRTRLAWLLGRTEDARRLADESIAYFQSRKWMPRQEPGVLMGLAYAQAYAGRADEAVRDARAALADQSKRDVYAAFLMQDDLGHILVICGRRDEAIAVLRTMTAEMSGRFTPNEIRFDPIWSRLKDDPRFEEILKSAKPL